MARRELTHQLLPLSGAYVLGLVTSTKKKHEEQEEQLKKEIGSHTSRNAIWNR